MFQAEEAATLLTDDRFSALFKNEDFQVDPESEEFQLLNPALDKLEKSKKKRQLKMMAQAREVLNNFIINWLTIIQSYICYNCNILLEQ